MLWIMKKPCDATNSTHDYLLLANNTDEWEQLIRRIEKQKDKTTDRMVGQKWKFDFLINQTNSYLGTIYSLY